MSPKKVASPPIGIYGPPRDAEVERVVEALAARGHRPRVLDSGLVSRGNAVTVRECRVLWCRQALDALRVVYLRQFHLAHDPWALAADAGAQTTISAKAYRSAQTRVALSLAVLLALRDTGVKLVNDFAGGLALQHKSHQIDQLRQAGLAVPLTLVTNSPAEARAFARAHRHVVMKPLIGAAHARDVLADDFSLLGREPALLQRFVEGPYLRVTVVDGVVVSAGEFRTRAVDVREDPDLISGRRHMSPRTGDRELVKIAIAAARATGLLVAGVDLVRSDSGYVVLECNPAPAFTFFEAELGQDIAGPIAELLIRLAGA